MPALSPEECRLLVADRPWPSRVVDTAGPVIVQLEGPTRLTVAQARAVNRGDLVLMRDGFDVVWPAACGPGAELEPIVTPGVFELGDFGMIKHTDGSIMAVGCAGQRLSPSAVRRLLAWLGSAMLLLGCTEVSLAELAVTAEPVRPAPTPAGTADAGPDAADAGPPPPVLTSVPTSYRAFAVGAAITDVRLCLTVLARPADAWGPYAPTGVRACAPLAPIDTVASGDSWTVDLGPLAAAFARGAQHVDCGVDWGNVGPLSYGGPDAGVGWRALGQSTPDTHGFVDLPPGAAAGLRLRFESVSRPAPGSFGFVASCDVLGTAP